MYFAVVKLLFEDEGTRDDDRKDLRSLAEKIRSKFKVTAAALNEQGGQEGIAIAALASSEERLNQMLDGVSDFCEDSGFGRIASEQALVDHIDSIEEIGAEEDSEGT